MSDNSYANIENVVTGSFLKIRTISGLPDESDGYNNRCGNYLWKTWNTSSLSIPSQSNVEVIDAWPDLYTDSYTVINGDKKFGTFTNLFASGDTLIWNFKPTIELSIGDYLADEDGQELEITSISVVSSSTQVFPISEINVEPQDYYYTNGVIMHNVACLGSLWSSGTTYAIYAEVRYPSVGGGATACHYYSGMSGNVGNTPVYTSSKGVVTGCTTTTGIWISKGTCTYIAAM